MAAVAIPVLGTVLEACGSSGSGSASAAPKGGGQSKSPWPQHPNYTFALVNHVTTNPFFVPTRYGAQDACTLLGCSYTWSGSATSLVSEMVTAMDTAIDRGVDGIGIPVIDATAFNQPTNKALSAGIPVVAYNAEAPTGSGNNSMAYIGQDLFQSGVDSANRILNFVKSGDLVAGMIATPGSLNLQPRIDGAKSVLAPKGIKFEQVATGALTTQEISTVDAWYQGHSDVKFIYAVDDGSTLAVAEASKKYGFSTKGIHTAGYDVSSPTPQDVQAGALDFTIDQQAYLQGFLPILQLFLYKVSGGLLLPSDTDTGLSFVTKTNVGPYLKNQDRYEGSSSAAKVLTPPAAIAS